MKKVLIREAVTYTALLIFLSFIMHPDLFLHAPERFSRMYTQGIFYHPFIYALIVYIVLFFVRVFIKKAVYLVKMLRPKK